MGPGVAVVGRGYWGENLVRNFHALGVLRAVCDHDPGRRARQPETRPGVAFTGSLDEVLSDRAVHAVAIATPPATHYAIARAALERGRDVFVEKPLASSVEECEELIALADRGGRILMVDHILRYHPAVRKLQDLVAGGALGEMRYLYSNRLNIGRLRKEENILWSFAPHDVSVILALVGRPPVEVRAFGEAYLQEGVYDTTVTSLAFSRKLKAHIFVSWLHPFKEQKLVVVGSRNMAVFDDLDPKKLWLYPHTIAWVGEIPVASKAERIAVPLAGEEPLAVSCAHFLDCLKTRKTPVTDGREGLAVLRVLQAAQAALDAATGTPSA
jgi:UDP-2-acetamido-3-amino-2,3-dideoxy-glucuronate N-acetyltransferase